jgi:hypothetical protein
MRRSLIQRAAEGAARAVGGGGRHGTGDGSTDRVSADVQSSDKGTGSRAAVAVGGATGRGLKRVGCERHRRRRQNEGVGGLRTWAAAVGERSCPRTAATRWVAGEDEAWVAAVQWRRGIGGMGGDSGGKESARGKMTQDVGGTKKIRTGYWRIGCTCEGHGLAQVWNSYSIPRV